MKHGKRIVIAIVIFWLFLPIGTWVDYKLMTTEKTQSLIIRELPNNPMKAMLYQNIWEVGLVTGGMLLGYLLYRKDIHRWFK